jgi:nucleotide-binding universal stress UspA family protein
MFKNILIPLDGAPLAERALEPALRLARASQADVGLVTVTTPEPAAAGPAAAGEAVAAPARDTFQAAWDYLEEVRAAQAEPGYTLTAKVMADPDPAAAIVEAARSGAVDLIAMSSHGYTGLKRWVLGSVAEKVLEAAPCPVLVLRSDAPLGDVLIPLDGSPFSEQALAPALAAAACFGGRATLLRVVPEIKSGVEMQEDPLAYFKTGEMKGRPPQVRPRLTTNQKAQDNALDEAQVYLRHLAARLERPGLALECAALVGLPAATILNYAEGQSVSLIAMATHGRTGVQRWLYGSVTSKVLRGGQHSMLVVRPR